MKKYKAISLIMSGFVLGVFVSYAPALEAATAKLLGSTVVNVLDVKIDTKSIGQGAVINGTTYVPLRSAATAMGMDVKSVTSEEVVLLNKVPVKIPVSNHDKIVIDIQDVNSKISQMNITIKNAEDLIAGKEYIISKIKSNEESIKIMEDAKEKGFEGSDSPFYKVEVDMLNKFKKILQDTAEAEKNLPAYKEQLSQLETQLADLQKQLAETK